MTGAVEAAMIVSAVAGVASEGVAMEEASQEAVEREADLDMQAKQTDLTYTTRQNKNYQTMRRVLDAQTSIESGRGVDLSSPSFGAIQMSTYNKGATQDDLLTTEKSISSMNLDTDKRNVKRKLYNDLFSDSAAMFGDVSTSAMQGYGVYEDTPRRRD